MARQRKKRRTQAPGSIQNSRAQGLTSNRTASSTNPEARIPKSMVLRMGGSKIGPSVSQLALDVRSVMEPHTASKLKERKTNKLRDFTTMARPLGVSHILAFYRSEKSGNVNLNVIVSPRGPTFAFRVETYSLARDIFKMQKRPKSGSGESLAPSLLVMNNFKTPANTADTSSTTKSSKPTSDKPLKDTDTNHKVPKHLEDLAISVFQSMFPAVQPQKTPLDLVKRVLLLNRIPPKSKDEEGTYTLQFRHYAITTKKVLHLSKGIKRLRAAEQFAKANPRKPQLERPAANIVDARAVHNGEVVANGLESDKLKKRKNGSLPDLHNLDDVADYILDPAAAGYTSASETEADTDAEVEVLQSDTRKVLSRKARQRLSTNNASSAANPDQPEQQEPGKRSRVEKRAIKLSELGPRMTLRLIKVQEGVAEGRVLWHEYLSKSAAEEKQLEKMHEQRRVEKEERRRAQKENVERKKAEKKAKGKSGDAKDPEEEEEEEEDEDEDEEGDDLDDEEMFDDDDDEAEEEEEQEGEDEEMEDEGEDE